MLKYLGCFGIKTNRYSYAPNLAQAAATATKASGSMKAPANPASGSVAGKATSKAARGVAAAATTSSKGTPSVSF
jgi:hypothetical protein